LKAAAFVNKGSHSSNWSHNIDKAIHRNQNVVDKMYKLNAFEK